MQFKARFTVEFELLEEADSPAVAESIVQQRIADFVRGSAPFRKHRILGVIPIDQEWPDAIQHVKPRGGVPPSGSPGTPTAKIEEQPVPAVAEAA